MKHKSRRFLNCAVGLPIAAVLAACGGSSSSDNFGTAAFDVAVSGEQNLTVQPGGTIALRATAKTSDAVLSSLSWAISGAANAPVLGVTNANCAAASKSNTQQASNWDCQLNVTAPVVTSAPMTYTVVLTAVDALKNSRTVSRTITASFDPSYAPKSVIDIQPFSILSGATAPLYCNAPALSAVSWTVTANGGLPISLESYSTAQTSFVAPDVKTPTPVTLTCTSTDSNKLTQSGSVVVTINPPDTVLPASVTVTPPQNVKSGATVTAKLTVTGSAGTTYYQWAVAGVAVPPISLINTDTSTVSFVAPTVLTPTTYKLLVSYGTKPITQAYTGVGQEQAVVVVSP